MVYRREYNKIFHQKHREKRLEYMRKWRQEHPEYSRKWKEANKDKVIECRRKWNKTHPEYLRKHYEANRDKAIEYGRKYNRKIKMMALSMISKKIECINCGCDDIRLLEVNHINGGGTKESKILGAGCSLWLKIISGKRKTDDLDIRCKVCNTIHYVNLKYGNTQHIISYQK